MKICSKCLLDQPFENFNKEVIRKDGFYPWCKSCLKEHRRIRYIKRPKHFIINNKICSYCKQDKTRDQFDIWESSGSLRSRCSECEALINRNLEEGKRRCGSCKEWVALGKFFKSRRDGHHSTCKKCTEKQVQQPSVKEKRRDKALQKFFGISLLQYKELLELQGHKCPICLKPLEGISNPVDHAHAGLNAGKIRAILHDRCNRFVMWKHHESSPLRRTADLIDKPLTDWIVPEEYLKGPKKKRKKHRGKKLRTRRKKLLHQ